MIIFFKIKISHNISRSIFFPVVFVHIVSAHTSHALMPAAHTPGLAADGSAVPPQSTPPNPASTPPNPAWNPPIKGWGLEVGKYTLGCSVVCLWFFPHCFLIKSKYPQDFCSSFAVEFRFPEKEYRYELEMVLHYVCAGFPHFVQFCAVQPPASVYISTPRWMHHLRVSANDGPWTPRKLRRWGGATIFEHATFIFSQGFPWKSIWLTTHGTAFPCQSGIRRLPPPSLALQVLSHGCPAVVTERTPDPP